MTDDPHGEDAASRGAGRWDPLPQGDYDDGATAFVQLPEGGIDALLAAADSPLAAPGHGYVPPRITAMPAAEQAADPAVDGSWGVPAGPDAGPWPGSPPAAGHPGHDDRFTYRPGDTGAGASGQWDVRGATGDAGHQQPHQHQPQPSGPGRGATGQWSIPVAGGELPDESGEFTTSSLVEQWGGNPPATLPGGAAAPWATGGTGHQGQQEQQDGGQWPQQHSGGQQPPAPTMPDPYRPADYPPAAEHPHEPAADGTGTAPGQGVFGTGAQPSYGRDAYAHEAHDAHEAHPAHDARVQDPHASYGGNSLPAQGTTHAYDTEYGTEPGYGTEPEYGTEPRYDTASEYDTAPAYDPASGYDPHRDPRPDEGPAGSYPDTSATSAGSSGSASAEEPAPYAPSPGSPGPFGAPPAPGAHGPSTPDEHPGATAGAPEPHEAAERPLEGDDDPAPETAADPEPTAAADADADAADEPGATAPDATAPDAPDPATPAEVFAVAAEAGADPVPAPPLPHDEHPVASYVLSVNGVDRPVTDAWVGESLLYVLRERLGLAGAKDGCSQGECGACNVQVDGRLVASCLVPAVTAAGSEVRTVEGLAVDGQPSDVQRALARCGAVQCGFCVPGMAMTVHDLLEGNPAPSERETRQALCGNLCRCSGYRGILDAVNEVVAEREAHNAAAHATDSGPDAGEPRIPHQAGPGDGGVGPSAFEGAEQYGADQYGAEQYEQPDQREQSYGQDGGQA